jgi:hypothetical protein
MCGMGSYPVVRQWLLEAGVKIRLAGTGGGRSVPRDTGLSLSPEQQQALKARYEAGATLKQLATEYTVRVDQMRRTLVTAGAVIRPGNVPVVQASEELIKQLADMYDKGALIRELIPVYERGTGTTGSYQTVRYLLVKAGVKFRPPGNFPGVPAREGGKITPAEATQAPVRRTRRRPTADEIRHFAKKYNQGLSIDDLVPVCQEICGMGSPRKIRQWLLEAGVTMRPTNGGGRSVPRDTGLSLSPKQQQALKARYEAGATLKQLATEYEISIRRMRRTLVTAGATIRYCNTSVVRASEELIQQLTGMYDNGASIRELIPVYERGTGMTGSYQRVRHLLIKAGVTLRPRLERATRARQSKVK